MASSAILPFLLSSCILFSLGNAATFTVINRCSYTIWAAASPGGGRQLNPGETWNLNVAAGTAAARIWGRTGCSFDSSGKGRCQSGDCGGKLACTGYGSPPNTLAEFALNQWNNLDFYDISLIDGFNIPMNFIPVSGCNSAGAHCSADVNSKCLSELKTTGGCLNACQVFGTNEYCCNSGSCGPTKYSKFFKDLCPQAYSYPKDDATSTFTCPGGTNYQVVFCPVKLQEVAAGSNNDVMDS